MNTLGQQLKALREMKRLGVRELAKRANVDPGFVTRIEGDQKMPSYETLMRLSHELGVTMGALEPYAIGALYGNWINGGHSPFEIRPAPRRICDECEHPADSEPHLQHCPEAIRG